MKVPALASMVLVALLGGCKDAPSKPAAGSNRQTPERQVGPSASGSRQRPPRHVPDRSPEGQPPDDDAWRERADRPTRADRIAEFDSDGDGKLSETERETMRDSRVDEQLGRIDQDGDGQISAAELEASPRGGRGIDFAAADTDGNGTLSRQELGRAARGRRLDGRIDDKRRRSRERFDGDGKPVPDGDGSGDAGVPR